MIIGCKICDIHTKNGKNISLCSSLSEDISLNIITKIKSVKVTKTVGEQEFNCFAELKGGWSIECSSLQNEIKVGDAVILSGDFKRFFVDELEVLTISGDMKKVEISSY